MIKGVDHTAVCIVFFCHDGRGNFLMNKRSKYSRDEHGKWDPGGGTVKFKESVFATVKRELKEEYCITAKKIEFLGFSDHLRKDEKDRSTHWISLDFKVLVSKNEVRNGEPKKHEEIGWFRLNKLPKPLHSQFPHLLKKYSSRLK